MTPGETFLGFDLGDHLWMVLSVQDQLGRIAVANLTSHGRSPACQLGNCVVVAVGEHPYVSRESCVYYRKALLTASAPLDKYKENGTLERRHPLSADLLRRVQDGALASALVSVEVQELILASLPPEN